MSIERLSEIREEMQELLSEAAGIVREESDFAYERARSYWIASIEIALQNDHGYLGGTGCSLEDTIKELEEEEEEEE